MSDNKFLLSGKPKSGKETQFMVNPERLCSALEISIINAKNDIKRLLNTGDDLSLAFELYEAYEKVHSLLSLPKEERNPKGELEAKVLLYAVCSAIKSTPEGGVFLKSDSYRGLSGNVRRYLEEKFDLVISGDDALTAGVTEKRPSQAEEEVQKMIPLAERAGREEIPSPANERYNLLMTSEFFGNDRKEMQKHSFEYGERFNLGMVSGEDPEEFISNVFRQITEMERDKKISNVKDKTIVLVPDSIPGEYLKHFTSAGIRFLRADAQSLLQARGERTQKENKAFQENVYTAMLLARHIDGEMDASSATYRLLDFYLRSHFRLDAVSAQEYIQGIIGDKIAVLVKGLLLDKPAAPYDAVSDYKKIAAALIFA